LGACDETSDCDYIVEDPTIASIDKVIRTEEEWKSILPSTGTGSFKRRVPSGPSRASMTTHWEGRVYGCYACELALFGSQAKFRSDSGWPKFWERISLGE
jgi:peptide-methionine (R)-S-oxide reductase